MSGAQCSSPIARVAMQIMAFGALVCCEVMVPESPHSAALKNRGQSSAQPRLDRPNFAPLHPGYARNTRSHERSVMGNRKEPDVALLSQATPAMNALSHDDTTGIQMRKLT